jgi:hypothetical protein
MTKTEMLRFINLKGGNVEPTEMLELINGMTVTAFERGQAYERERILAIIHQAQEEARIGNGGYKKDVAEAFGQSWPLKTGWKHKLRERIMAGEQE